MWRKELVVSLLLSCTLASCYTPHMLLPQSSHNLQPFYPQDNEIQGEEEWWREKRTGPSLSVVNPIEVLRSRLILEMARRKMQKMDDGQLQANRILLKTIGKRQVDRSEEKEGARSEWDQSQWSL